MSPENLTLDSIQKKFFFGIFVAFTLENSWNIGNRCLNELSKE